jgi:hypothetical protein
MSYPMSASSLQGPAEVPVEELRDSELLNTNAAERLDVPTRGRSTRCRSHEAGRGRRLEKVAPGGGRRLEKVAPGGGRRLEKVASVHAL